MSDTSPHEPEEAEVDNGEEWSKEDCDDWVVQMMDAAATWKGEDDLYHYTTIDGVLGILESTRLWGTHVAFLNDSQELEYGIETICRVLTDSAERLDSENRKSQPLDPDLTNGGLIRAVGEFIERNSEMLKPTLGPFVSCLSTSKDQLSQWRGYGKTGGYAIRFDPKKLESIRHVNQEGATLKGPDPVLVKVRYRAALEEEILKMAVAYIADLSTVQEHDTEEEQNRIRTQAQVDLFVKVLEIAPQIKHKSFAEEREYRIITRGAEQFYSPSTIGLIPRVLVQFDSASVKEVMVGPGEFSDLRKLSIERYLDRHRGRYPDVTVTLSAVPYRDI